MKFSRRDFLKMGGGAGVAIALGGGFMQWTRWPEGESSNAPGVEKWIPTICGQCTGGCGILVRMIDGWAVNIAGNPLHPLNRGTLCPKGIAGLQALYDPDRLRSPLKRIGNRGEGRFEPISWREALHQISKVLKELREKGETHQLVVLGGRYRGLMRSLWERFLKAFGSPNYIDNQFRWEDPPLEGLLLTQGIYELPAYDIEKAQYILSFGSGMLESFWSPVQMLRGYGHFRRGRPGLRGRFVQIESRLSPTGMKADEWVPIQPGTEGILALGIAHMILKEGLYHKTFIAEQAFGFENWKDPEGREHLGFKEFILSEYEPSVVSKQTGVPIDQIIRLAREFSSNLPSLAIGYRDRPFHQMAVSVLNGLVGSIDVPGGLLIPRSVPYRPFPSFSEDTIAQRGNSQKPLVERNDGLGSPSYLFAKNVISGKPYKPKVLFLYYTNPLFSNPNPDYFFKAFQEIPLIVSFSPYLDDSTKFSDLVLPDHTPFERWQDDPVFLSNGFPVLGIRQPVVTPLYQTKATGDVLLEIARELGGQIQKALPWNEFKEVMVYGIRGVFEAKRGDIFGLQFDEAWTRLLQRGGWSVPSYRTFEEFLDLLYEKGGWWDPVYDFGEGSRVFRTPSKKFAFYVQGSQKTLFPEGKVEDSTLLPHTEDLKQGDKDPQYPFTLHVFRTISLTGGRNANQPWLQSMVGQHLFERWRTWVEINPETAKKMSISDGDWVWVESRRGKIKAVARHYKGTLPNVVNIPFGQGHRGGGRWSKGIGENPYHLIDGDLDPVTGFPVQGTTRVKVYKV